MAHRGYFEIGKIVKPHGFNGALKLKITHPKANEIDFPESVFMEFHHKLIPFFFTSIIPQNNGFAIVEFDHITNEAEAKEVAGQSVYLPSHLEPIPEGKDFYHDELIDFKVTDIHLGELGVLSNVMEAPAHDVFDINNPTG
jgi:16S rRNA processing protein RimM